MIIAIEGVDAAGKDTHSKLLAKRLNAERFAFPYYESASGQMILAHLKNKWKAVGLPKETPPLLDPMVFQALQAVNRLERLPDINAALNRGHIVFDRYWQSAIVYGSLDGIDMRWLRLTQERPLPWANVNILIDIPVEESFRRRPERRDRYEVSAPYLETVRNAYLRLWGERNVRGGWYIVDGMGTVDEVQERIWQVVA